MQKIGTARNRVEFGVRHAIWYCELRA
jgi:hypothetical protein